MKQHPTLKPNCWSCGTWIRTNRVITCSGLRFCEPCFDSLLAWIETRSPHGSGWEPRRLARLKRDPFDGLAEDFALNQ